MQPDNSAVWNRKGRALYNLELFEQSLAAQEKAIELDPDNVEALADRGTALIGLGKFPEALEAFNQAQEIEPLDPKTVAKQGTGIAVSQSSPRVDSSLSRSVRCL